MNAKSIIRLCLLSFALVILFPPALFAGSIKGWGDMAVDSNLLLNQPGQFTAIAAGEYHSLALKSDGSIVGWGGNGAGQAMPPAGNNFIAVAAGGFHGLALKSDGSIVGWGYNAYGQADPCDGNSFVAIAAGGEHSLALKSDGSIVGWGSNIDWDGNWTGQATPPAGNNFIAVAAGGFHGLALKSDGSIVGWGKNDFGQATPPAGNDFIAIAAGWNHSLALKSDGSIVGWGDNNDLSGNWAGQATPPAGNNFIAIAAGGYHSLALKSDGSIVGWGSNYDEYYGNYTGQATPPAGDNFIAIAAGGFHSLALKSDGSIVGWGSDDEGGGQAMPPTGNDFAAVAAGEYHSLALKSDGSIVGWGRNYDGQATPPAGNNFAAVAAGDSHSLALKYDGSIVGWGDNEFSQATPPAGNDFLAVAAGSWHSLALKSDGSIVGWGLNNYGQATPPEGNNFIVVASGWYHSLALKSDGSIVGWGSNYNDSGGYSGQATPPSGNDFIAVSAGNNFSLALRSDGSIVGWGYNGYGQATPPAGNNFIAIAAGGYHSIALKSDGSIVGWGDNGEGQATPPAGNNFIAVSAGSSHSLAIVYTVCVPPSAPTGVSATDGTYNDHIRVTWNSVSGATGYEVWRSASNSSGSASKLGDYTSPFDDNSVTSGTYYYWVKAKNDCGTSGFSSSDSGYTSSCAVPSVPTGVSASDGTYTNKVQVTWNSVSDATGYEVWRSASNSSSSASKLGDSAASPFDDNSVTTGTTYYWVKARNDCGTSGFSSSDPGYASTFVSTRIIGLSGNLAFGSVTVGSSAQSTLTINNTGSSTMTVSSISYPGGFSGAWSGTIGAGGSQPVTVTFSPTSATSYGGTITVNSNMTSGTNTIATSGTGSVSTTPKTVLITKGTVTAGNKDNSSDTISISGTMNATADDFNNSDVVVTIDSNDMVSPLVKKFPIAGNFNKRGKFNCSIPNASFALDTKTGKFSFTAKNADLSGLSCPLTVQIKIGDSIGTKQVDEDVINGKKLIPINLMMGVKNILRVDDNPRFTRNKKTGQITQVIVSGGFSLKNAIDMTASPFSVSIGTQTFSLPANTFKNVKGKFTCSKVKLAGGIVAAAFDPNKCTFTLTIKGSNIPDPKGAAKFKMEFGGFSEGAEVSLP